MVDQSNSINFPGLIKPDVQSKGSQNTENANGADFKSLLVDSINEVNRLQTEADEARMNLATGKTDNIAEVFTAVKKAELAFQTLMQIRNNLMDAYNEIKQMRV